MKNLLIATMFLLVLSPVAALAQTQDAKSASAIVAQDAAVPTYNATDLILAGGN